VDDIEQQDDVVSGANVTYPEITFLHRDSIAHSLGGDRFSRQFQRLWQVENGSRQIRIPATEFDTVQPVSSANIQ